MIIVGVVGFLIIILNWCTRFHLWFVVAKMSQEEREGRLGEPFIPLVGGLFVCMFLSSLEVPVWVRILPLILYYGCLFGVISFI